jgi:hypothetical protein
MNRLLQGLVVLAGCVVLMAGAVWAEDLPSAEACPLPDMKDELPRVVGIIEAFGTGNLDAALDLVEAELPGPFPKASGPFDVDIRERWRQEFAKLAEIHPQFESVDFIGYQPISSASRTLVLIGNGKFGPIRFRVRAFRYQEKWRLSNLSYHGSWDQIEADNNFTRFPVPANYPLAAQPIAQTDDE